MAQPSVDRDIAQQRLDLDERREIGRDRIGRGGDRSVGKRSHVGDVRELLIRLQGCQEVLICCAHAGPGLFVQVAVRSRGEVRRRVAAVHLLHRNEQAAELVVDVDARRNGPGRIHSKVPEDLIAHQLVQLARVPRRGVQVEALETVEPRGRIVPVELQLDGQLRALELMAAHTPELVPAVVQRVGPLVPDADFFELHARAG
jgi:hypothetical protein